MMPSKISWTDETINPIIGCSKIATGCQNCYAERIAKRLVTIPTTRDRYDGLTDDSGWCGVTKFVESELLNPLKWKRHRKIFVCSMGDLFHESVPFSSVDKVLAIAALCQQHAFQILTKRPQRMREFFNSFNSDEAGSRGEAVSEWLLSFVGLDKWSDSADKMSDYFRSRADARPNLWLGISASNQKEIDESLPILLETQASKRFVSLEPLLGPVNLDRYFGLRQGHKMALLGRGSGLNWVICGGESGPKARPMHPDWVRSIRDQCVESGTPFFFKQWGEWAPDCLCQTTRACRTVKRPIPGKMGAMFRCGKKASGSELDGKIWEQFPK